jgi:hypothetical protein
MAFLIKNGEPVAVPQDWTKTPYLCPVCKKSLYYVRGASGARVWCPWGDCSSLGMNEGGHGITLEKALGVLMVKNGFGKDFEYEMESSPDVEVAVNADAPVRKRGRKKKGEQVAFTVPPGEWTMKDFCVLNNTYATKALTFFKTNKVREVGKKPNGSGRGKPATIYTAL